MKKDKVPKKAKEKSTKKNSKEKKEIIIMVTPTLVDETTPVEMSTDMKDFIKSSQKKEKPAVKKK